MGGGMTAAHYALDNVIAFVDWNGLQIDGEVSRVMNVACIKISLPPSTGMSRKSTAMILARFLPPLKGQRRPRAGLQSLLPEQLRARVLYGKSGGLARQGPARTSSAGIKRTGGGVNGHSYQRCLRQGIGISAKTKMWLCWTLTCQAQPRQLPLPKNFPSAF